MSKPEHKRLRWRLLMLSGFFKNRDEDLGAETLRHTHFLITETLNRLKIIEGYG